MNLLRFALFAYASVSLMVAYIQEKTEQTEEVCDWYIDPSTREFVEIGK